MKVLLITGDKSFGPGHPRYELQKSAVEELAVLYWRGNLLPNIPAGKFDVVTAQDPFWRGHLAWHISRRIGAKLNIQVHTDLSAHSGLKRAWAGFNLRRADSVRVVSEKVKQQVMQLRVRSKISVLPIFVDVHKFHTVTPKPHPQKTVLWVGRFEEEKDPLLALEIIANIPDAKLILLGKGSQESILRKRAKQLPVEFPGWQDPVLYLPTADVVLSTSKYESYGASIVEALAAGVPVVAPDVGVAREAGAVVVPRADLGKAVVELLHSSARGALKIKVSTAEEWAKRWKESL